MKEAIEVVFSKTYHRNCRWHVIRPWERDLDRLHRENSGFKEKIEGLLNFPLSPTEFEVAWGDTMREYGLEEYSAIRALWDKRPMWMAPYFKSVYCGQMTSTQRSESTNRVLKDGFVNHTTSLHMFAKRMLEAIQHMDQMEAQETWYSEPPNVRACLLAFDDQFSQKYSRNVYKDYTRNYKNSTAFEIRADPNEEHGYLVRHAKGTGEFCWSKHEFKVHCDKVRGEYRCECMCWEHTGLFCSHLIWAFTHLQVGKIPGHYILKRYTRDAMSVVEWDRHDIPDTGPSGTTQQMRLLKLIPIVMAATRSGSRSDYAFEETMRRVNEMRQVIDTIQADGAEQSNTAQEGSDEPTPTEMVAPDGSRISASAPPVVPTKGRKRATATKNKAPSSHTTYKRKKTVDGMMCR
ncbi:hypothetical protein ACP70R_018867 [Stipagrostis hirtigluma subsp. patula]